MGIVCLDLQFNISSFKGYHKSLWQHKKLIPSYLW